MNYKEAMDYIKNTAKFGSKYGLQRTKKILEYLGNPEDKLKCIHIAGTNGKGSTTAMISNILREAGYKVGMYTSPYLEEFEERIQINGANIPKNKLCDVVLKVSRAVEEVIALGYDHPTEFEIITCAMYLYFYEEAVDFAVVEVGLGGRLDSTNVIVPLVSVITSISYDHMNILGNTLEEIAFEKAGIIKPGIPVILYHQAIGVEKVITEVCHKNNSQLIRVDGNSAEFLGTEDKYQKLKISTSKDIYEINLSLLGKVQIYNCAVAVNTIESLEKYGYSIHKKAIYDGLSSVLWKGRMEIMKQKPMVVIDGAHNIDGIEKLAEGIKMYFKYKKLYLIIGILADKQVDDMLSAIVPMAERVIAVTPHSDRAEDAYALRDRILQFNADCVAIQDYEQAYLQGLSFCEEDDLLIICGSLYMIGDMRKRIKSL